VLIFADLTLNNYIRKKRINNKKKEIYQRLENNKKQTNGKKKIYENK